MPVYLVAYDLIKEKAGTHDYQPLYDQMKNLDAQKVQFSLWLINLDNNIKEVHDHFKQFIDDDDRLWITQVKHGEYRFDKGLAGTRDWVANNLPS